MERDWDQHPDAKRWLARVRRELTPMIRDSAITALIAPGGEPDAKLAVELGMSILLDKPIVVVAYPGRGVPEHLARVADEIVEGSDDPAVVSERIQAALSRLLEQESRTVDDGSDGPAHP